MNLLDLLKYKNLTPKIFQTRVDALQTFDENLAETKCYVNFFCNCGVRIDVEELKAIAVDLAAKYDFLQLERVKNSFKNWSQHSASISWLFSLRSSALFLSLWRETGNAIIAGKDPYADAKVDKKDKKGASEPAKKPFWKKGKKEKEEKKGKGKGKAKAIECKHCKQQFKTPGEYRTHLKSRGTHTTPDTGEIGRAVQQECRDRSRMPSSA
eukprot:TRINITY_DN10981_c0_g2_i4.p1 TRINITY_DN10981_c0_g2~~TRINITY_DN10981_c0_g2_i4.p1  ORF type:complete len:227 (-),score=21.21 TRINITY_DN10981_c0_g2_i4:13-645(-)